MSPIDILRVSLSTFIHNKMRTLLTVIGISIGIGTIVFLLSLGYGLQNIAIDEISSIKALSTINVTSGNSSIVDMSSKSVEKMKGLSGVESADPNLTMSGQIVHEKTKTDVLINAVSAQYLDLESPKLELGSIYTEDQTDGIVLTSIIANAFNLSPKDLMNQKVKVIALIPNPSNPKTPIVTEKEYTVIGIIKDSVASYLYMPLKTLTFSEKTQFSSVKLKTEEGQIANVKGLVVDMGYKATSLGEKISQMNKIFDTVKLVLLIFGAIALVVASIGMFNTLTISLLERTRDIGIMKSLGATDGEIYRIFLTESTLVSTFGGIFGVGLAYLLGIALNFLLSAMALRAGGEAVQIFQAPMEIILVILGFSVLIGLLTGIYPARRAARLNPLDALRYE